MTSAVFLKDDQPDGRKLNPIEPIKKRFIWILLIGNYLEKIGIYLAENSKDMLQLMIQDKSFVFQMLSKSATKPIFQQNQTNSEQQPQN